MVLMEIIFLNVDDLGNPPIYPPVVKDGLLESLPICFEDFPS